MALFNFCLKVPKLQRETFKECAYKMESPLWNCEILNEKVSKSNEKAPQIDDEVQILKTY